MNVEVEAAARAAKVGAVPATDVPYLEEFRRRHEELAGRLAAAAHAPERARQQHDAKVAAWHADVRAAAWVDGDPPPWDARLSDEWLAGRVNAAHEVLAGIADELSAVLRDAHAACDEHGIDGLVAPIDDGYGGALIEAERRMAGAAPSQALPAWARQVHFWRSRRHEANDELNDYVSRQGLAGAPERPPRADALHDAERLTLARTT